MFSAGGKTGIHHGCPLRRVVRAREEVILPAQCPRPYGVLHAVVVDAEVPVTEVVGEPIPPLGTVVTCANLFMDFYCIFCSSKTQSKNIFTWLFLVLRIVKDQTLKKEALNLFQENREQSYIQRAF